VKSRLIFLDLKEVSGACDTHGIDKYSYKSIYGKPEGKRPIGRPRRRWKDNIKMYLKTIGCEGMSWIHVDRTQCRVLVNMVITFGFHEKRGIS
jgi:hypothetical protein